jgi:hypothetical protein
MVFRETKHRQFAGKLIKPIREMLFNFGRFQVPLPPEGIVSVLEFERRQRTRLTLLKASIDRR